MHSSNCDLKIKGKVLDKNYCIWALECAQMRLISSFQLTADLPVPCCLLYSYKPIPKDSGNKNCCPS